jgi:hypothetical protein
MQNGPYARATETGINFCGDSVTSCWEIPFVERSVYPSAFVVGVQNLQACVLVLTLLVMETTVLHVHRHFAELELLIVVINWKTIICNHAGALKMLPDPRNVFSGICAFAGLCLCCEMVLESGYRSCFSARVVTDGFRNSDVFIWITWFTELDLFVPSGLSLVGRSAEQRRNSFAGW